VSEIDPGEVRRARPWRRRRRALLLSVLALVALAAGAYGVHLWRYWDRHVSTDDAFVEAHVSPVSARVRGTVVAVLVRDNQEVPAGAPLVRLDPRDLEAKVRQARAAVAAAEGRLRMVSAGVPLTDESTRSQVALAEATAAKAALGIESAQRVGDERRSRLLARRAAVQAAQADVTARRADFERARLDRGRMEELFARRLIARQDFDHADSAFQTAAAALEAAVRRRGVERTWCLTGEDKDREAALGRYRLLAGGGVLVATPWFREGMDVPEIDAGLLAGGSLSEIAVLQGFGRMLRPRPDKAEVLVYDALDGRDPGVRKDYLAQHALARLRVYRERGWAVERQPAGGWR